MKPGRKASGSSKLYAAMAEAEKSYPSELIGNNEELRQLLQKLKYQIVKKWTGAKVD